MILVLHIWIHLVLPRQNCLSPCNGPKSSESPDFFSNIAGTWNPLTRYVAKAKEIDMCLKPGLALVPRKNDHFHSLSPVGHGNSVAITGCCCLHGVCPGSWTAGFQPIRHAIPETMEFSPGSRTWEELQRAVDAIPK